MFPEKMFLSLFTACIIPGSLTPCAHLSRERHPTLQDHPDGEFQGEASPGEKGYNADVTAPL